MMRFTQAARTWLVLLALAASVAAGVPVRAQTPAPQPVPQPTGAVGSQQAPPAAPTTPPPAQRGPAAAASRQLVIPFENATRDPRAYWLSEGSAVILTDDLRSLGVPAITRDDRLRAFDRLRIPNVPTLSHATAIRLGQIVGAAQVVVGTVALTGDDLVVTARTIRVDAGRMSPVIEERGSVNDVFGVYARLARRLAPESRVTVEQVEANNPPIAAFEQFIKGVLAENLPTKATYLTQALKLAPTFQRPRIALWNVYNEQGSHRQALAVARDVPVDSRLSRQARFLAAVSLMNLSQYQDAYDALARLNQEASDPALLNNLGVVQLRRPVNAPGGRAASFFDQAVSLDRIDSDLFFNLGYAHWLERDAERAVQFLREAVRRNPADHEAHYVLGVALQAAGNAAEGTREKELARRLSSVTAEWEKTRPVTAPVPRGLERVKMELDVPASLRVDNVIVAAGQRDQQELARIHLDNGRRLLAADRDAEALAELRRAVYLAPYQSEAHLLIGRAYLKAGRPEEAVDALKIAIWSEDTIAGRLALADAYLAHRDVAAARTELQTVLQRDPANADARRLLDTAAQQAP